MNTDNIITMVTILCVNCDQIRLTLTNSFEYAASNTEAILVSKESS